MEIASRSTSLDDLTSLFGYLPDPDPVLRKTGNSVRIYRELLSDPHLFACVEQMKSGILSMEWDIDRGKSKSRQAKAIRKMFLDLDMNRIIGEILDAVLFGYSVLEIRWEYRDSLMVPADVVGKPQEWFVFGDQNELRFLHKDYPGKGIEVPMNNFLLARNKPSYKNPYGEKVLSRCFWPVSFKKGIQQFWLKMTEKFGMPHIYAFISSADFEDEGKRAAVLEMLSAMVQDGVAVMPIGSTVNVLDFKQSASVDLYERGVEFYNKEISKAVLTVTTTTELGKVGSYAASQTHSEHQTTVIESYRKIVEQTMNRLIALVSEYNFPGSELPSFILYEEQDVDKALAERDELLVKTGLIRFTTDYFKRNYGFEDDDLQPIATPGAGEDPTGSPSGPAVVLNGAQVTAASSIVEKVTVGQMPRDSGVNQLMVFFGLTKEQAEAVIGSAGKVKPKVASEPVKEPVPEFKEPSFPDQDAIDELMSATIPKVGKLAGVSGPIMKLLEESSDFDEAILKLGSVYPDLKTDQIEEVIERAIFISEVWGRINAR